MSRILIVAPSPILRAGLESLVERAGAAHGHVVVAAVGTLGTADDGGSRALADDVLAHEPDVVLWAPAPPIDDDGPPLAWLRAVSGEEGDAPGAPAVVALVEAPAAAWTMTALRAGVRAVLPREATAEELVAAVDAAAAGLVAVPVALAELLVAPNAARAPGPRADDEERDAAAPEAGAPRGPPALARGAPVLTPRELQVLALLAEGLVNKQIAGRLGISEHTVKAHVAAIFAKLDAGTRAEAVVTAARLGLLML